MIWMGKPAVTIELSAAELRELLALTLPLVWTSYSRQHVARRWPLALGVSKTWGNLLALGGLIGVADA